MEAADTLEETLKDKSLQKTSASIAEVAIDSGLEPGILKDIPVLGTLVGVGTAFVSIKERLYLRKLAALLECIESVPAEQRAKVIDETNQSLSGITSVGEKVLHVVDRSDDARTSKLAGLLFRAYLEELLTYEEFADAVHAIQRVPRFALTHFICGDHEEMQAEDAHLLYGTVLIEPREMHIAVEDQWDHKSTERYVVTGGENMVDLTKLGLKVRSILRDEQAAAE